MKKVFAFATALLLSACTQYALVPPGNWEVGGKVAFVTDVAWNGLGHADAYEMTVDGPLLQQLTILTAIEDGKTLFKGVDLEDKHDPFLAMVGVRPDEMSYRFRKTMTEPEIMDLFAASFAALHKGTVEPSGLAPASVGGKQGFRFDYVLTTQDSLRRKGTVVGAVVKDKLTLLNYVGTSAFHYEKTRANFEQIVATLTFKEG